MNNNIILVVAACLVKDDKILLAQRPVDKDMAGLWEFPGGKVEIGETPEAALVREITEELNIYLDVKNLRPLSFAYHQYPTKKILILLYICDEWQGDLKPVIGQNLEWVKAIDLTSYQMPAADVDLVKSVQAYFMGLVFL